MSICSRIIRLQVTCPKGHLSEIELCRFRNFDANPNANPKTNPTPDPDPSPNPMPIYMFRTNDPSDK